MVTTARAALPLLALLAFALAPRLAAADPEPASDDPSRIELTVKRVVVFKDGYALFVREGKGMVGADGRLRTNDVPDSAVLGTFWALGDKERPLGMEASLRDREETVETTEACVEMRELLAEARPLRANFAALAIENSSAVRQFLAMAQILHHIDADTPIRMLIAECEQPTTVLAALYFARMFGIDDKVDVSPLFETENALEHGGRFLDALLAEPAYRDYASRRGRLCIQTGFSDAGRFVGQIPAALAIERLHGRLAEAMVANGLTDVAALIFNTHGESMGRGAHPCWAGNSSTG